MFRLRHPEIQSIPTNEQVSSFSLYGYPFAVHPLEFKIDFGDFFCDLRWFHRKRSCYVFE
jgi:hypothetical protein